MTPSLRDHRSASTRSPSRCSADRTRSGSSAAALLFGALRAGAGLMQIEAGIPVEIVDVIQAIILLFLAADVVVRHLFRIRARRRAVADLKTVTSSYGGQRPADGTAHDLPRLDPRRRASSSSSIGYLVATMPDDRPDLSSPWRPRSPSARCAGS